MKGLVPGTFTLLSSTVPVNEAQIFTHRVYPIGEKVVFGNMLYERLTATDTYEAFNNRKWYKEGELCTDLGINYLFKKQILFDNPSIDTINWSLLSVSEWALATLYTSGDVRAFKSRIYLCITNHTSPSLDSILDWYKGKPSSYYTGGYCRFNNRYYKLKSGFQAYKTASLSTPSSRTDVWADITEITVFPSSASSYWVDITDQIWVGDIFYNANSVTIYESNVYKLINDLVLPTPASDTLRWTASQTSLPTNTTDWKSLGAVNRFKMFDEYFSTYTEFNGDIQIALTDVDFNAVFIGNIFADSVLIEVINNETSEVVESNLFDLTYDCVDIFDYFFGDWMDNRISTVIYSRTSMYKDVSVQMTMSGDLCRVGIFVIGKYYYIGDEAWGASDEALLFHTVIEDTSTGELYIQKGNELGVKSIDLWVDTNSLPALNTILKKMSGIPMVFISKNNYLTTYGFYRKKHNILPGPTKSMISIEIRELL